MKWFSTALAGLIAISLLSGMNPAFAEGADASRKVRVGYFAMPDFQEYDETTDTYSGYSYDYLLAIAQYANWEYEFVPVTYDQGLKMLADGELDLMNDVEKTEDTESAYYLSSIPSGESCTCLVVNSGNTDVAFDDYGAFGELTVAFDYSSARNSAFVDYCKDNDCMPKLLYCRSQDEVEAAMRAGVADACLVSNLEDTDLRTIAKFGTQSYYFATTKGNSDLLKELNTAMNALKTGDPYFEEKIYSKYHGGSSDALTVLTSDEKAYVASAPVIRVSCYPSWYPVSYFDENKKFQGAMADIFKTISDRTGLQFEYVYAETQADALAAFASGETQVMAGFPYDYACAGKMNATLTTPLISMTVFAAERSGESGGTAVAVPKGSYFEYLGGSLQNTGFQYQDYNSTEDCLNAVLNGGADCVLIDAYQLEYYETRAKFRDLSFKVMPDFEYRLSLATSSSADTRLSSVLEKAVNSIGSDEVREAFQSASLTAGSHSLRDVVYTNPSAGVLIYTLFGFVAAVIVTAGIYSYVLRKKNRELRIAARAKADFLSNMSHDMRTPLNGILGYTDLAIKTDDAAQEKEYLRKILISGSFLLDLINDTLDMSKIESEKFTLTPQIIDSREIVENAVVPIQSAAETGGVQFVVDTSRAYQGYVRIDRINTQKIILNLLSNAVKFTPPGGKVTLTIEDIEPDGNKCNTRIIVSDTGIGISDNFLPKLFEPFTQENDPNAGNAKGTGLGLSIVHHVVALMGGSIKVESKKGQGTRFTVLLPVERLPDYVPPDQNQEKTVSLEGKRVLLCEDNAMNTEIAKTLMEQAGMLVETAENGAAGVEMFARSSPDWYHAVLMDLRMPVMDGFKAARAIRALSRPDAETVPILAISADAYEEDVRRCFSAGMNGHISKPIDPETLFGELRRLTASGAGGHV